MKSLFLPFPDVGVSEAAENRLLKFSFLAFFRRLFRSPCSSRTLAVKDAVAAFFKLNVGV